MSVTDLVRELETIGVRLWEDDGRLRYRAPEGVMTEERLGTLRASRDELLAHLKGDGEPPALTIDAAGRHAPFPLSDVQAAYLFGRRDVFDYGGVACHGYGELEFPELDPERMELAWRGVVARHDMLRAVIDLDGSQRVLPEVAPYEIEVADLRGQAAPSVADALSRVRGEMDHRVHDPSSWPLFELRITLTDERAYLHVSIDFLIADFISIQLLLDELHRRYADPGLVLPALEPTFRDYLLAERRLRSGARHAQDRDWWLARLDELPAAPELPVLPAAASAPPRFVRHELMLAPEEWTQLRRHAGTRAITPSAAVLAAYTEVIGRWSRRLDFTLDLTVLNRLPLHPQVSQLIGDFTSVELLAVHGDANASFAERAAAQQAQLFEDLDHRLFGGVELLREIARRDGTGRALFPVVFTSAVGLGEATTAGGAEAEQVALGELGYGISQTPQVWIDCQVMERQGALSVNWDVREGVFAHGVVEDMFDAFERVLRQLAVDQALWDATDPVTLPQAQRRRRQRLEAEGPLPNVLLHEPMLEQALRAPERAAVVDRYGELSYGELLSRALAVSDLLHAHGCEPGERVAVIMDKGREQVIAVLGTLLAGAVYVPVDIHHPPARRELMLARAGARLVLAQSWLPDGSQAATATALAVDEVDPAPGPAAPPASERRPDDLAYIIFTSGSTGVPKGVMITHRGATNTIDDVNRRYGITGEDRVLGLAALGFDLSVYDVFGTLGLGGCLILPDPRRRSDPSHWARLIARHGVTVWNSVPAQLQMLGDYLRSEPDLQLETLRLAMLSGDWIPVGLPDQIRGRVPGLRLISMGGATEAAIWSIFHEITEVPDDWRSIPYGRPLTNQTVEVLDDGLRACPDWTTGELYIGGSGLAEGYLGDEDQTRRRFIAHPRTGRRLYRTGDLGRYLPNGEIEFLGRADSQVKIRGHRIELAEIEAALQSHPAVGRAAVVVDGDGPLDRRLAAFVEPAPRDDADANDGRGRDGARSPDEPVARARAEREVARAAAEGGEIALDGIDRERFAAYMGALNDVALESMLGALRHSGLFATEQEGHDLAEIVERTGAAARHHRLLRRWLRALTQTGTLVRDGQGRYRCPGAAGDANRDGWKRAAELGEGVDDAAAELLSYFQRCAEHLPALLTGDRHPLQLLFPDGRVDVAEALYQASLINRWTTAMLARATGAIAELANESPLRVLEVGAGVGGSTADVLAALAPYDVDYLFTDLSRFFINAGRERFGSGDGVRFGVYDLDRDFRAQGLQPNAFDVVLAADVLHSTRHVGETLGRLRELIAPGGWLVFVEMTRDQYQIMASLELLTRVDDGAQDFLDLRRGRDQTFLEADQWLGCLRDAGVDPVLALPESDDPLSQLGMRVIAGRVKRDRMPLRSAPVLDHLRDRLPEFMVPSQLQIVDELPLTSNGKIDQRTLREWLAGVQEPTAAGAEPRTETERRVAAVWAEMFGVERVERDRTFFDLGGDSLLAAQVAGRMREIVPEAAAMFFDDLLRTLLEGPTVAALAETLVAAPAAAAPAPEGARDSPVIVLSDGDDTPPFVLIDSADGRPGRLVELADPLAAAGPVLALAPVGDGDATSDRDGLARLAGDYARSLCAEGHLTVRLVGFGGSATLALEVARALLEAGAEVATLAVADTAAGDALEHLSPDPYLGDIRLLSPVDDPPPARARAAELWTACCLGELEVVSVPGVTATMLEPVHVPAIVDALVADVPASGERRA